MKKPLTFNQKVWSAFTAAMLFSLTLFSQQFLTTINGWNAYVHLPDDYSTTTQTYPTIIFFPGTGEVGTNAAKLLTYGPSAFIASGWNGNVVVNGVTVKPIIISLQPTGLYPQAFLIDQRIETIKTLYRVDTKRISLTGLSMGGWITEMYVQNSAYSSKIASVVALQAVKPDDNPAYPAPFSSYAQNCGRWLGYEQINDQRDMKTISNTMNAAVPGSAVYFLTNVSGGGHCCWNTWYDPNHTDNYSLDGVTGNWSIYQYMLTWSGCTSGNVAPTANAGSAQSITLPISSVTLNGSGSTGNGGATISSYSWVKTSGGAGTITTPGAATTTVTGLVQGTYVFTLTVTDNNGLTNTSTVTITVNPAIVVGIAPTANAGSAQSITLPISTVTLNGTGSTGNGGATISSYAWVKTSGGAGTITTPGAATTTVTGLVQGTYVFTLTVTDNNGLTNTSTVTITVNAAVAVPPTANAGTAQSITLPINTVTLNATGSTGNGGATISSYAWVKTSGGAGTITTAAAATTTVTGLVQGTYVFTLTVTDNNGLTNTSTVTITVNAAAAIAPTADAGSSQSITLPINTITLNGSASTGNGGATISSYAWVKTSGGAGTITTAAAATTTVTGLVQGTYVFTLTVTDNNGLTNTSTVTITVNAAAAIAPTADAGSSQSITLPINSATLNGSGSTGNGGATISSYAWVKTSGGVGIITTPGSATTTVTGLVQGTYVFTLTVTDNNGLTNTSTVTIIVNPAIVVGIAPTASAGSSQSITLPINTITLNGTGSTGNGGATISSYAWVKTSGGAGTITTPGAATTTVTGLVQGTYVFTLTVTDNNGLTNASTVTITVNAAAAVAPTANAGSAQSITLPINTVTLNGTGSTGNGGATISSYAWVKTSGGAGTITTPGTATTTVTGLAQGTYVFTLTVTDNNGLTNSSTVTIIVNPAIVVGTPPTANAGSAQNITLPISTATLNGTGSTGNGGATISSYAWVKTSGGAGTITTPGAATTTVTGLVQGTYVFTLTVTDNNGLTNTSTVTITVSAAAVPPTANAGSGQSITLPTSTVTLNGSGSTGNGGATISSYSWVKTSGGAGTITTPAAATTTVTGLVQGTYVFTLTVTDNKGMTNSSAVTVIVYAVGNTCGCDYVLKPNPADGQVYVNGQTLGVKPGDKVCLAAGNYTHILLFNFYGSASQPVTIVNCGGLVNISGDPAYGFILKSSRYVNITGAGDPGYKYGILVDGTAANTNSGFAEGEQVSDIELDHMEIKQVGLGVACAPTPNCTPSTWSTSWKMYNMSFHDMYVHETRFEGFYIGNTQTYYNLTCSGAPVTVEPQKIDSVKFYNNIIDRSGWTSAQISQVTGGVDIHDNLITNYGYVNKDQHQAGLIVGGVSHGDVYNNKIINGTGNSFQYFGAGLTRVYNNVFAYAGYDGSTQGQNAVLMSDRPKPPGFPGLKLYMVNNTIIAPKRNGISFYNDYGTVDNGNIIANNLIVAPGLLSVYPPYAYIETQANPHATLYNNLNLATIGLAKFANPGANDFHILSGSPAIDAGINGSVYGVIKDIDRNARPYGASYDIGAFEYNGGVAPPLTAEAGADQNITLPVNSINVNGSLSNDPSGTITSYTWSQISGPNTATIVSGSAVSSVINNLIQGTYKFRLVITDDLGRTATDSMTVVVNPAPVNPPPVANAGGNQTITLPINSATLNGTLSTDAGGTITGYAWTQVSGPNTATVSNGSTASATASNLVQGTYQFRLVVTDNDMLTGSDVMTLVVNPAVVIPPPVANAGGNQSITLPTNTFTLDGSRSNDPAGEIITYTWTQLSGPNTANIVNASSATSSVNNLIEGTYQFRLFIQNDNGLTATDIMTLVVKPAVVNQAPIANAGGNLSITLPTNTLTLNGTGSSDVDGSIVSNDWIQLSGPNTALLTNGSTAVATVSGLVEGTYQFRLTVTDNGGLTGTDIMTIVVNPAIVIPPPIAVAGATQTITLPVNSVTVSGSSSSVSSGSITGYSWSQVSGPSSATISNSGSVSTQISDLVEGVYQFQLTITDDRGVTDTDVMTVVVNPAIITVNNPPIADAGANQSITLPANAVLLDGSMSIDPGGIITSYSWSQVSGPSTATIADNAAAKTIVDNLVEGTYQFQLTITDDGGLISTDIVTVIVNPAVIVINQLPVANAGSDKLLTAGTAAVQLDGSASYDPDGIIIQYSWIMLSGAGGVTTLNPATNSPTVTGLIPGVYVFELTVTDDRGATSKSSVQITVASGPVSPNNLPPVARAGKDTSIFYYENAKAVINGSASFDADGIIVSYGWRQVSGPVIAFIPHTTNSIGDVEKLTIGVYEFELTVTDDKGASSKDTVKINVVADNLRMVGTTKLYPNPVETTTTLEMLNDIKGKLKMVIYDATGKLVYVKEFNKQSYAFRQQLNLSRLLPGSYVLHVYAEGESKPMVFKLIKQ